MREASNLPGDLKQTDILYKQARGAIHVLTRCLPLIFEDREFYTKAMWTSTTLADECNAIILMEAISLLLFKPGFTIKPISKKGH